jgi:MraZ protein
VGLNPLKPPFFYGNFPLTVDSKHRLLVPSKLRKEITPELGESLIVTQRKDRLWMYPSKYYEQVIDNQVAVDIMPDEVMLDYLHLRLALADEVEWDNQGRVVLPAHQLADAGIDKEVTLIGMRDHLELWSRKAWDDRRKEVVSREADIEVGVKPTMRKIPLEQPGSGA